MVLDSNSPVFPIQQILYGIEGEGGGDTGKPTILVRFGLPPYTKYLHMDNRPLHDIPVRMMSAAGIMNVLEQAYGNVFDNPLPIHLMGEDPALTPIHLLTKELHESDMVSTIQMDTFGITDISNHEHINEHINVLSVSPRPFLPIVPYIARTAHEFRFYLSLDREEANAWDEARLRAVKYANRCARLYMLPRKLTKENILGVYSWVLQNPGYQAYIPLYQLTAYIDEASISLL